MNQTKDKVKITDPSRVLTLANFISFMRGVLAIPLIYTLRDERMWKWTLLIIILAILSDALDGYFARRAHEVTHFGKWLDPVADFVIIFATMSFLVLQGRFPFWFYMLYFIRHLTIAAAATYVINHSHLVSHSSRIGKWYVTFASVMVVMYIFEIEKLLILRDIILIFTTILLIISWYLYLRDMYLNFKKA